MELFGKASRFIGSSTIAVKINKPTAENDGTKHDHEVTYTVIQIVMRATQLSPENNCLQVQTGESNNIAHILSSFQDVLVSTSKSNNLLKGIPSTGNVTVYSCSTVEYS
ncbi:uncharacterized protein [Palaemon carinicauda]|uniref:uncharacterized protein n=1 Tax=Palaemon carinicauda TaxID=392227 RepID=UPI0035B59589